jgi:hypothetical protein
VSAGGGEEGEEMTIKFIEVEENNGNHTFLFNPDKITAISVCNASMKAYVFCGSVDFEITKAGVAKILDELKGNEK